MAARSLHRQDSKSSAKILLQEYCSNSSIHGVRYFNREGQSWCESGWWIVVFLLSVGSCGYLINKVYQKWDETPVIVSFHEKTTPVWKIPFPAVTICPRTKWSSSWLNFSEQYDVIMSDGIDATNRTDEILALMQLCDRTFMTSSRNRFKSFPNKTTNESYVDLMKAMPVPFNTDHFSCHFAGEPIDFDFFFRKTLTEEGLCYTFNGLSSEDLLKVKTDPDLFAKKRSPHWTLDSGYSSEANLLSYPYRSIGPGALAGLSVMLVAQEKNLEYGCSGPVQGYKVLLHSPADYPQMTNRYIHIPLDQEVMIAVKPQMIQNSRKLEYYPPERRQCYLSCDRSLRFFRVYTQDNCNLECLTNYTMMRCGCVRFSMVRSEDMPVCETNQISCMQDAETELLEMGVLDDENETNFHTECDCMPGCTSVDYDVEITQNEFEIVEWAVAYGEKRKDFDGVYAAHLKIYYKNAQLMKQKRSELYGITDFLANCGGLLGLCLGVSLLSLVELCYYCSVRPLMLWKKWKQEPTKVDNIGLPEVCLLSTSEIMKQNVRNSGIY
ncbi:pickpocket protein 28-like [Aedes albopictus]|uniref:Pickpocket n=1 Tax=Aedes albopictus TaxID=7160 RepID=A0ABM1Z0X2_AEDAL|nr:pickpocket protein 28-like [Aedes albopictus]